MPPQDQLSELARLQAEAIRVQNETAKAVAERQQKQAQAINPNVPAGYSVVKTVPEKNGIVYRSPDGKLAYVERGPDGGVTYSSSREEEVQRILAGEAPGQARRTDTQKQILEQSGVQAGFLSAIKGITGLGEGVDEAVGMVTGDARYPAAMREMATAFQEQKPLEAFGGQAAMGAISTLPFIPVQAAGRAIQAAPTLLQGMLKVGGAGAVAGATEGAVSGFLAGEGSAEQRIPSAQSGALFGGGFGAFLGAGSEPARFAVENMVKFFGNAPSRKLAKDLGISEQAAKVIQLFLKEGDIDSARAALARAGSKSMLAEVSPGTKRLLDAAIELGSGSQGPLDAIELRVATSNKELDEGLNRFFGGAPRDVTDMKTDIVQATAEARQKAYDAAYASPINYNSTGGQNLLNQSENLTPDIIAEANLLIQTDPYLRTKPPPMKFERPAAAGAAVPDVAALKQQGFNTDKVYYHGGDVEFDTFDMTKAGRREVPWYGRGAYLTPNRNMAKNYAAGGKVMPFYVRGNMLQIRKPEDWPSWLNKEADIPQQLKDRGYVGLDIDIKTQGPQYDKNFRPIVDADGKLVTKEESMPEVVVFDPANIVRADRPTSAAAQPGRAEFETPPTVMQWDYIARALQDRAKRERREVATSKKGANYEGTLNNIRSELKTQIPVYRDALGIAGDTFAEQEAMDLGERLLQKNTTVGEITRFLETAEKPQIEALKKGIRADIESEIKSVKTSALNPNTDPKELSAALSLLRIPNNMTKMRAILGQQEFDDFYKLLDEQATSIELMGAVARNSKTAGRQDIKQTAEQVLFGGGILSQIGRGKVVNTQEVLVQSMTGLTPEADAARRMGLFDDVASVLTRLQGQDARDALEMIELARRGRVLTEPQARIIAKAVTKPAAMALYAPLTAGQRQQQNQPTRPYQSGMGRPE